MFQTGLSHFLCALPCTQRRRVEELGHNPPTCNSLMAAINTFTCLWVHSYTALQHNKSINRSDRCLTLLRRCRLIRLWLSRARMWSRRTCGSVEDDFYHHESGNARLARLFFVNAIKWNDRNQQPVKRKQISCLRRPHFLTRNPPTQKTPLKPCSKQQVGNLQALLSQMWLRQQRPQRGKPQKHSSCKE